jgi:hypothetical protein
MMRSSRQAQPRRAIVAGLGLLVILGCGSDGLGKRYSVTGKVTYKGSALPSGTISFLPEDSKAKAAVGTITDGYYRLTTLSPGDGAFPGKYQVTVVSKDVDSSAVSAAPNSLRRLKTVAAANLAAKSRIPARYELASTSGLVREVLPQSNTFDFDLSD